MLISFLVLHMYASVPVNAHTPTNRQNMYDDCRLISSDASHRLTRTYVQTHAHSSIRSTCNVPIYQHTHMYICIYIHMYAHTFSFIHLCTCKLVRLQLTFVVHARVYTYACSNYLGRKDGHFHVIPIRNAKANLS